MSSPKIVSFISPVSISCSIEKPMVYVKIIPRQLINIVTKSFEQVPMVSGTINDALGYQSIDDAIISAKSIGLALLSQVIPENLFFFFGESVKTLNYSFFEFNAAYHISYNSADFYAPIYGNERYSCYESNTNPLVIVLCKLINSKQLSRFIASKN